MLALRCLVRIGGKRRDVNEPATRSSLLAAVMTLPPIGMADEDRWTLDPTQGPFYRGDIAFGRVETVLFFSPKSSISIGSRAQQYGSPRPYGAAFANNTSKSG